MPEEDASTSARFAAALGRATGQALRAPVTQMIGKKVVGPAVNTISPSLASSLGMGGGAALVSAPLGTASGAIAGGVSAPGALAMQNLGLVGPSGFAAPAGGGALGTLGLALAPASLAMLAASLFGRGFDPSKQLFKNSLAANVQGLGLRAFKDFNLSGKANAKLFEKFQPLLHQVFNFTGGRGFSQDQIRSLLPRLKEVEKTAIARVEAGLPSLSSIRTSLIDPDKGFVRGNIKIPASQTGRARHGYEGRIIEASKMQRQTGRAGHSQKNARIRGAIRSDSLFALQAGLEGIFEDMKRARLAASSNVPIPIPTGFQDIPLGDIHRKDAPPPGVARGKFTRQA